MAQIYIHPTGSKPGNIRALQARTGMCAIITGGAAHLVSVDEWQAKLDAELDARQNQPLWTGPGAA